MNKKQKYLAVQFLITAFTILSCYSFSQAYDSANDSVSFAYPCGQTFIGRGINIRSYVPLVAMMFESGRGWLNEAPNDPSFCDLAQLNASELDGKTFDQVLKLIETAQDERYWLILSGHEINTEGNQTS